MREVPGRYCGTSLWTHLAKIVTNIMCGVRSNVKCFTFYPNTRITIINLDWSNFDSTSLFIFFNFTGSLIVSTGFYWISAGLYAIMDFTQMPKFLMKYKIQTDKNVPLDPKRFVKASLPKSIFMALLNVKNYSTLYYKQLNT